MTAKSASWVGVLAFLAAMASPAALASEAEASEDPGVCKWLLDRVVESDRRANEARKDIVTKADYVEKIAVMTHRAPIRSNSSSPDKFELELTTARQSLDIAAAISAASEAASSSALTAYVVHCPKQFSSRVKASISQRSTSEPQNQ